MESFPSLLERTVASALLLLSTLPPSLSPPADESKLSLDSEKSSLGLSTSRSCPSIVTNDDGSSAETRAHPLRMIAAVARSHEMKLKVVQKSRTKKFWKSDTRRPIFIGKPTEVPSERAPEMSSSCVSSSSSAVSTGRSGGGGWNNKGSSLAWISKTELPAGMVKSGIVRRRAEAIKRLLSKGCMPTSETRIRQLLGDSPDTSKALRMLLKREEVKRSGAGGRHDPYLYMMA